MLLWFGYWWEGLTQFDNVRTSQQCSCGLVIGESFLDVWPNYSTKILWKTFLGLIVEEEEEGDNFCFSWNAMTKSTYMTKKRGESTFHLLSHSFHYFAWSNRSHQHNKHKKKKQKEKRFIVVYNFGEFNNLLIMSNNYFLLNILCLKY
jgi:hypothetical protein